MAVAHRASKRHAVSGSRRNKRRGLPTPERGTNRWKSCRARTPGTMSAPTRTLPRHRHRTTLSQRWEQCSLAGTVFASRHVTLGRCAATRHTNRNHTPTLHGMAHLTDRACMRCRWGTRSRPHTEYTRRRCCLAPGQPGKAPARSQVGAAQATRTLKWPTGHAACACISSVAAARWDVLGQSGSRTPCCSPEGLHEASHSKPDTHQKRVPTRRRAHQEPGVTHRRAGCGRGTGRRLRASLASR